MIELEWITNEVTKERRLYYRTMTYYVDASGALNVAHAAWGQWVRVPELTLDESSMQDIIESGGIANAP
jgi:hypothetical protein